MVPEGILSRPQSGASSPFVNLAGRCLWHNAVLPSAARREHEKECLVTFLRPRPAAKSSVMQILYSRGCGIDVHKDSVTVRVLVYTCKPEPYC